LLQIDDVHIVAHAKEEGLHFWIPTARIVAEVNASFKKLPQRYDGHRHVYFPFPVNPPRIVQKLL
jgi:hypothetical protein